MDRESGRSKGFGFVTYNTVEEASSAIQALDGQVKQIVIFSIISNELQNDCIHVHGYQYLTIHTSCISVRYKIELNQCESLVFIYFGHVIES